MDNEIFIKEKDVLDLAWKYFQQHAQQRISYFNFFIVFSGVITTAWITTFQDKYNAYLLGILIGLMQSITSFIFLKIDSRNRFLTRIGEDAIKEIESNYKFDTKYDLMNKLKIFTTEEMLTDVEKNKSCCILRKQISHGFAYKITFTIFIVVGIFEALISGFYHSNRMIKKMNPEKTLIIETNTKEINLNKNFESIDQLLKDVKAQDITVINNSGEDIKVYIYSNDK